MLARGNYLEACGQDPLVDGLVDIGSRLCVPPASQPVAVEPGPAGAPLVVHGVWPNPVRGAASVELTLGQPVSDLMLEIFDLNGRMIFTSHVGARPVGAQEVSWEGTDQAGRPVSNGLYFVRVAADGVHQGSVKALVAR